jgi:hypothetical protein
VKLHGKNQKPFTSWRCTCSCGAETEVLEGSLRRGRSTSCGCLRREVVSTMRKALNAANPPVGENHPRWKGGRNVTKHGYIDAWVSVDDPLFCMIRSRTGSGGYVGEHRLVVARALGRPLRADENVHHVNGKKDDNRLENLQLMTFVQPAGQCRRCRACGSCDIEDVPIGG